jgi:hypothetical protein
MDPYGIEKVQGNRYTDLTGKIVIQVKRKNKRLIDSEQRTKNKEQRLKKGKDPELA